MKYSNVCAGVARRAEVAWACASVLVRGGVADRHSADAAAQRRRLDYTTRASYRYSYPTHFVSLRRPSL